MRVPDGDWIPADREGLTLCDATSAAFAMNLPWDKLDVVTWSWQKVLGGEAQHGMLVLSPRAVARLESYTPPWPMPKIFRMTKGGKLNESIFEGSTINTPSMLCVEDHLDALDWSREIGGIDGLIARSNKNFAVIADWVESSSWARFLAADPAMRSTTSVCLTIADPWFESLSDDEQAAAAKAVAGLLDKEGVAFDVGGVSRCAGRAAYLGRCHRRGGRSDSTDALARLGFRDCQSRTQQHLGTPELRFGSPSPTPTV